MSTPKPAKPSNLLLWEEDMLSPIQNRLGEDLSDSDMSDSYTTARSGYSKRPIMSAPVAKHNTRSIPNKQEVSQSSLRTLPTVSNTNYTYSFIKFMRPLAKRMNESLPIFKIFFLLDDCETFGS